MDEEKDNVKHYEEMCEAFPDYPCAKCGDPYCYKACLMWEEWFCNKWQLIRHNAGKLREEEREITDD